MEKTKWSQEFWTQWQQNPKQTAQKLGWNWDTDADASWKDWDHSKWKGLSIDEGKKILKQSKWASWVWWD